MQSSVDMKSLLLFLLILAPIAKSEDCPPAKPSVAEFNFVSEYSKWVKRKKPIQFDVRLLGNSPYPCPNPGPFLALFETEEPKKSLAFLAIDHVQPPVKIADSELATIQREIESFKPNFLIVETIGPPGTITPSMANNLSQGCRIRDEYHCTEPQFVLDLASQMRVNSYGGEPSSAKTYEVLSKKFFMSDVYAFASTRAINTLVKNQTPRDAWPTEMMKLIRQEISQDHGPWSFQDYQTWITKNYGSKANIEESNIEWLEPRSDPKASKLQKLSYLADRVRDPHILKTTQTALNQADRTMLVYGNGHFLKQRAALEKALGPAKIQCLK